MGAFKVIKNRDPISGLTGGSIWKQIEYIYIFSHAFMLVAKVIVEGGGRVLYGDRAEASAEATLET